MDTYVVKDAVDKSYWNDTGYWSHYCPNGTHYTNMGGALAIMRGSYLISRRKLQVIKVTPDGNEKVVASTGGFC